MNRLYVIVAAILLDTSFLVIFYMIEKKNIFNFGNTFSNQYHQIYHRHDMIVAVSSDWIEEVVVCIGDLRDLQSKAFVRLQERSIWMSASMMNTYSAHSR